MKGGAYDKIGYANNHAPNIVIQILSLITLISLTIGLFLSWSQTLLSLTSTIAIMSVIYAALRLTACIAQKPKPPESPSIEEWPFYTVLVPLFHEANMVPQLMDALSKLDYPRDKLEIFMICEAVDPSTVDEVRKRISGIFHLIIVPPGTPQTKPRALNFAMQRARGEFVTIYDAEDIPHPNQLKAAIHAFQADPTLGALQAPLDYANANSNALTRQFGLEYAALFHVWLPFLRALKLPFPLGGTSNHMRSHNVTEDADLSFRLAARNWQLGYITPPTQEEVVSDFKSWHFQRARWMKGYMQTWRSHMRAPFAPGGLSCKIFYIAAHFGVNADKRALSPPRYGGSPDLRSLSIFIRAAGLHSYAVPREPWRELWGRHDNRSCRGASGAKASLVTLSSLYAALLVCSLRANDTCFMGTSPQPFPLA